MRRRSLEMSEVVCNQLLPASAAAAAANEVSVRRFLDFLESFSSACRRRRERSEREAVAILFRPAPSPGRRRRERSEREAADSRV